MPTVNSTKSGIDCHSRVDSIRLRAEELYRRRGNRPGSAMDDWLRAEKEICEAEERMNHEASVGDCPERLIH